MQCNLTVAGAGPTTTRALIDHLALRADLEASSVRVQPRFDGGITLSDHDGVVVEVGQ